MDWTFDYYCSCCYFVVWTWCCWFSWAWCDVTKCTIASSDGKVLCLHEVCWYKQGSCIIKCFVVYDMQTIFCNRVNEIIDRFTKIFIAHGFLTIWNCELLLIFYYWTPAFRRKRVLWFYHCQYKLVSQSVITISLKRLVGFFWKFAWS